LLLHLFGRLGIVIASFHTPLHEIGLPIPLNPRSMRTVRSSVRGHCQLFDLTGE
jgi:hypothetical protein